MRRGRGVGDFDGSVAWGRHAQDRDFRNVTALWSQPHGKSEIEKEGDNVKGIQMGIL